MTSWVVADSGLYLAIALKEIHAPKVSALIRTWTQTGYTVAAPYLFRYELVSVIRKHIARGNMTIEDGRIGLQGLRNYPVETFTDDMLLERAFEIANQHNRPAAYDSMYLALAEHLNCDFWTTDLRLFNAVSGQLAWVKWIGNFPLPQP